MALKLPASSANSSTAGVATLASRSPCARRRDAAASCRSGSENRREITYERPTVRTAPASVIAWNTSVECRFRSRYGASRVPTYNIPMTSPPMLRIGSYAAMYQSLTTKARPTHARPSRTTWW